jgi:AcrR family transcriptional regulator
MPRPKEAILSRSLIRDQALAIIDEDGLDALTMRQLATRLGVQAASLYTHFANKDAVLDAIADRLATRIDPAGFADSWQDGLRAWANSFYTALHWHPNAAPVLAARTHGTDDSTPVTASVQQALSSHGWPEREAVMITQALKFLVLGAATNTSGSRIVDGAVDVDDPLGLFADTVERASFTLALDSLIRGLEDTYADVAPRRGTRRRATAS